MAQLTMKQKIFVDEYLIDLNATQAAIRAGYSKKTAYRTGADNLIKPQIQAQIQKRMKDREERTEITQDFVLRELYAIANANGADFAKVVNGAVEIEPTDRLPEEKKKAIAGIKQGKHGIEVNTCDKIRALELLGRHLGMFTDKVKVEVDGGLGMLESIMNQLKDDPDHSDHSRKEEIYEYRSR